MVVEAAARTTFTTAEADEIRALLDGLPGARKAEQRMSMARLRRIGLDIALDGDSLPTRSRFEELVSTGALMIDEGSSGANVRPHPSGNVFRVAVGVTGDSVAETWDAFEQRYQWFGRRPQAITSGAHLFVLAVDRWRSAVVGLYEAVSPGAEKLPGSSDPDRWPWALGVRPLAAIPPPDAERVEGQLAPQSGLPVHVSDPAAQERLYRAVAGSPPPPGPRTLEQRVQELDRHDVVADVLEAVRILQKDARREAIVALALELGGWNEEELEARAWYTGSGVGSHIENIVQQALRFETGSVGPLKQVHGVYSVSDDARRGTGFGVPYRMAAGEPAAEEELPAHLADLAELDRATKRHMRLQDRLAEALRERGVDPLSPGSWEPQFDLAFEHGGNRFVVEVKSGDPVGAQQIRLGGGQLLEYRHRLGETSPGDVRAVLLVESEPPPPWDAVAASVDIMLLRADRLEESLAALLAAAS